MDESFCQIVYFGPHLVGKSTNLEILHKSTPPSHRGNLSAMPLKNGKCLYWDFFYENEKQCRIITPPNRNFCPCFRQHHPNITPDQYRERHREDLKFVLGQVDGIIFVADSQKHRLEDNIEALAELRRILAENDVDIRELPLVMQWNKRDMPNILGTEELEKKLNLFGVPSRESVAIAGWGVASTLKSCLRLIGCCKFSQNIHNRHNRHKNDR